MRAAASADDSWGKRLTIPLDRALKKGAIIRGKALGVDDVAKKVSYQPLNTDSSNKGESTTIAYDYLVITTGAQFQSPFKPASLNVGETQIGKQCYAPHGRARCMHALVMMTTGTDI